MARRAEPRGADEEPPSLHMVLSGAVAVVAVVAFVAAVAFGTEIREAPPGARLGVVASQGPLRSAIVVPRCEAERVVSVELRGADGSVVWRVVSRKGSIDERYVVGSAEPPFGFVTEVSPTALPSGPLTAAVTLDGEPFDAEPFQDMDEVTFDPAAVPTSGVRYRDADVEPAVFEAEVAAAANCQGPGRDLGLVTWLFVAAALGVVATYLMMLSRYVKGRSHQR